MRTVGIGLVTMMCLICALPAARAAEEKEPRDAREEEKNRRPDPKAVQDWLTKLKSARGTDRANLARRVKSLGFARLPQDSKKEVISALIEMLADKDAEVRVGAAEGLQSFGADATDAVPVLDKLLNDRGQPVGLRRTVATSLGKIGPPAKEAADALTAALKERNAQLRVEAALALFRINPDNAEIALSNLRTVLTKDKNEFAQKDALLALAAMKDKAKDAVPDMLQALKRKGMVAFYSREALGTIGPVAVPALVEALKDKEEGIREEAASILKRYYPEDAKKAGL